MSSFVRKLLYGEERKKDFTEANLPVTRREQFGYVIKRRGFRLLAINTGVFTFFIPVLLWRMLCLAYESSFDNITIDNVSAYIQYVIYYKSIPRAVCMGVAGLGLAGGFHAIRMIVWGEPVGTARSFLRGIRYSFVQYFIGGMLYGVFCMIIEIVEVMIYSGYISDKSMKILAMGSIVLSKFLLVASGMFAMALLSNYNIKVLHCIKNSILLVMGSLFKTAGFIILSLGPSILWFVTGYIFMDIIGILILLLCGFAYSLLIWCLYTNSIFDRYINQKNYPEYYRKGLRKERNHNA